MWIIKKKKTKKFKFQVTKSTWGEEGMQIPGQELWGIWEFWAPYLDEFAEGCIGWVVSDQETKILISDFHRGWTVHNGKKKMCGGPKNNPKKEKKTKRGKKGEKTKKGKKN